MPAPKTATDELTRVAAVVELGQINDHSKTITDALVLVLKTDKSDFVRSCAALSLARFVTNNLTVSNAFVEALHDNDAQVRNVVAEALKANRLK